MAVELQFDQVLRVLTRNEVEFILVGGVAAILQGSPLTTEDIDVVYLPSDENNLRLVKALRELDRRLARELPIWTLGRYK